MKEGGIEKGWEEGGRDDRVGKEVGSGEGGKGQEEWGEGKKEGVEDIEGREGRREG